MKRLFEPIDNMLSQHEDIITEAMFQISPAPYFVTERQFYAMLEDRLVQNFSAILRFQVFMSYIDREKGDHVTGNIQSR